MLSSEGLTVAYRWDHRDYTVSVEGTFIDRDRWLIHAVVDYRPDLGGDARRRLVVEARTELLLGIVRESQRGRDRGAARVHALVEGDPEVAGLFDLSERTEAPFVHIGLTRG